MPHWKPQEMGELIKRTKHKAWCVMCGDKLQKGDAVVRKQKHGIRLLCKTCNNIIWMAGEILREYKRRIQ